MKINIIFAAVISFMSITATAQNSANFINATQTIAVANTPAATNTPAVVSTPGLVVDVRPANNATLILRIENNEPQRLVTITVKERSSGVVYASNIRQAQVALRLRFDESADGKYEVIVRRGNETWSKTVTLQTRQETTRNFIF